MSYSGFFSNSNLGTPVGFISLCPFSSLKFLVRKFLISFFKSSANFSSANFTLYLTVAISEVDGNFNSRPNSFPINSGKSLLKKHIPHNLSLSPTYFLPIFLHSISSTSYSPQRWHRSIFSFSILITSKSLIAFLLAKNLSVRSTRRE